MRALVMDGVIQRRPLDLRSPAASYSEPVAQPVPKPLSYAPETSGVPSIDGVRRPLARAEVLTVPFEATENEAREAWLGSAIAKRYRWAGVAAVGLLIPGALLVSGRLAQIIHPPALADRQSSALPSQTSPPISAIQLAATSAPTAPVNDEALIQLLHEFTTTQQAPFGIVIKDLKTGVVTTSSPDEIFASASLYKLFVAHAIYKKIDTNQLTLSASAGNTGRNVAECLRIMINISDNDCGRALGALVGWDKIDADLKVLGFKNTSLSDPQRTSAADVALLLERLYKGTLLSPSSSEQFIGFLKDQHINNRLPAGLPAGTPIAHKTGDLDGFVHDAGIVYGPKTDYLIVMTSGPWSGVGNAPAVFADLSNKVFAHLNQ